jgi:hypothetical protein
MSEREEDQKLYADIRAEDLMVERVLCGVHLPVKVTDPIRLSFHLTEEQAQQLRNAPLWKFSVYGVKRDYDGEIVDELRADAVYSGGPETTMWGIDVCESTLTGKPTDLRLTHFFSEEGIPELDGKVSGTFWLTPNVLLEPAKLLTYSYTGAVEVKTAWQFRFLLPSGITLSFDHHYRGRKSDDTENVRFKELVACFQYEGSIEDERFGELQRNLDDVLLLASFAARRRCVCLGWDAVGSERTVDQYLRNKTIPADKDGREYNELIDLLHFEEFMETAYVKFTEMKPNDSLRRAINFVLPKAGETVDSRFVSLYSALEMLVLHFRRERGLELIVPENNVWRKIRRNLISALEAEPLLDRYPDCPEEPDRRELIAEKLSELNRIAFAHAFEKFCEHHSVQLQDLWRVTGSADGVSLTTIRNKLVHGEVFDSRHYTALGTAMTHLLWIVERVILAMLGWDVTRSTVSPEYLGRVMSAYREWKMHRSAFSR